jgi:hypothetical protein
MKAIKKAVCVVGTYKDRQTGAEKKQYLTVGKLMQRDDGSMCLKMDAVPVSFDGWVNFYDLEKAGDAKAQPAPQATYQEFEDKDLPF